MLELFKNWFSSAGPKKPGITDLRPGDILQLSELTPSPGVRAEVTRTDGVNIVVRIPPESEIKNWPGTKESLVILSSQMYDSVEDLQTPAQAATEECTP